MIDYPLTAHGQRAASATAKVQMIYVNPLCGNGEYGLLQ